MAFRVEKVEYYYTTIMDRPGEAYKILAILADLGVNLFALTAVPVGPTQTQLTLFPENPSRMKSEARMAQIDLDGP